SDRAKNRRAGYSRQFKQQERALPRETQFGNRGNGSTHNNRRKRRVPKAHALQIYPRKKRSKRAGCNEETGQSELFGSINVGLPTQPPSSETPQHDIPNRDGAD